MLLNILEKKKSHKTHWEFLNKMYPKLSKTIEKIPRAVLNSIILEKGHS